jgi:hypothetical protein
MKKIRVSILKNIPGHVKGQIVEVAVDGKGIPLDRAWRRRLADAKTDSCIEIMKPSEKIDADKKIKQEQIK